MTFAQPLTVETSREEEMGLRPFDVRKRAKFSISMGNSRTRAAYMVYTPIMLMVSSSSQKATGMVSFRPKKERAVGWQAARAS